MKFQPKRFVVEVKRGTSRASFASPDASADRFSDAEAALFGSAGRADAKPAFSRTAEASRPEAPSGRILRSLVEPPAPVFEEPPPVRRGRKPGSKNKPKPQVDAAAPASDAERPRRGRKPGSKNKPKTQVPTAFPPASAASQQSLAAAMRSYGFADDGTVWTAAKAPATAEQSRLPATEPDIPAAPIATAAPVEPVAPSRGQANPPGRPRPQVRLRDRSSILKRYVLDIEPRPGQPGAIRARRLARAV